MYAGNTISVIHGIWHADTQTVFAGSDGSSRTQIQEDLTTNSHQATLEYGRMLVHSNIQTCVLNDAERDALVRGPHVYGAYNHLTNRMPRFNIVYVPGPVTVQFVELGMGFGGGSSYSSSTMHRPSYVSCGGRVPMLAPSPGIQSNFSVTGVDFAASTRGGVTSMGASVTLSSTTGGLHTGSTTLGCDYRFGDGGRTLDLRSSYTPPSLTEFVSLGTSGVDPMQTSSALTAHMAASAMILQATARDRMSYNPVAIAAAVTATYRIAKVSFDAVKTVGRVFSTITSLEEARKEQERDAKEKVEKKADAGSAAAATGGPQPDPDDDERKKNCGKSESQVWKELKPYKGGLRTDGKGDKIYDWDHTHNDIGVYNSRGDHLGSMNPVSGEMYKPAVAGRSIMGQL